MVPETFEMMAQTDKDNVSIGTRLFGNLYRDVDA